MHAMSRLPACSDHQISAVLAELRAATHRPVSGLQLRRELKARFGIRAGTDRIYRLLALAVAPQAPSEPTAELIARLTAERDAALARAELAELREVATQDRTANEIHELRQKVRASQIFKT
jgi:hypothetical protein